MGKRKTKRRMRPNLQVPRVSAGALMDALGTNRYAALRAKQVRLTSRKRRKVKTVKYLKKHKKGKKRLRGLKKLQYKSRDMQHAFTGGNSY